MKFIVALAALALAAPGVFAAMEASTAINYDVEEAAAPEATPVMYARMYENLDENTHFRSARDTANIEAPSAINYDVEEAAAPEATPVMYTRMYENLDENTHYRSARDTANTDAPHTESNSAAMLGVAIPCVAAAVGVAGFAAYTVKRRQASTESAMHLHA